MKRLGSILLFLAVLCLGLWSTAALYFDVRWSLQAGVLRTVFALLFGCLLLALLVASIRIQKAIRAVIALELVVLIWWFTLSPTNNGPWQTDVDHMAYGDVSRSQVTIFNVRHCRYRTETDFTCAWETRQIDLASVRHVDLFLTRWGAPLIAHVIVSFELADNSTLAFSIEARKRPGQSYSAIRGFFRQYGLIYLAAEEDDVVRVRTNYREGEFVSLYRTRTTPRDAQGLLLQYVRWMNETRRQARWYNALTENCDRSIVRYLAKEKVGGITWWDWRGFLNGSGDKMLFDLGDLVTDGLPFEELQRQSVINQKARTLPYGVDFSREIRKGRAGFIADRLRQQSENSPHLEVPLAMSCIAYAATKKQRTEKCSHHQARIDINGRPA